LFARKKERHHSSERSIQPTIIFLSLNLKLTFKFNMINNWK
jgi:hypothetical protein